MEQTIWKRLARAGRSSSTCWASLSAAHQAKSPLFSQQYTRAFGQSTRHALREQQEVPKAENLTSQGQPAANLSQEVTEEEKKHYADHHDRVVEHSKKSQVRSPWMHEGSDKPPVATLRSAGAMVKGVFLAL